MSSPSTSMQAEESPRQDSVAQGRDARSLITMSSQMARLGYGEQVIEYALQRKGMGPAGARLVAASVVSCHLAILAAKAETKRAHTRPSSPNTGTEADLRAARAARHALGQMMSFLVYLVVGIGGGVLIGWNLGFDRGVEDGYGWLMRALEQLATR